jgi:predicted RNA-binding Zn-ribbon protein involved in translation (DUF1610 family)
MTETSTDLPGCPRCGTEQITTIATSPAAGVWEIEQCDTCGFTWRTTEPPRRSQRAHYPQAFRLDPADMQHAVEVPTVPPLLER